MKPLSELRQMYEESTQGEWSQTCGFVHKTADKVSVHDCIASCRENNANWIAAMHNEMPELLDELEWLRERDTGVEPLQMGMDAETGDWVTECPACNMTSSGSRRPVRFCANCGVRFVYDDDCGQAQEVEE